MLLKFGLSNGIDFFILLLEVCSLALFKRKLGALAVDEFPFERTYWNVCGCDCFASVSEKPFEAQTPHSELFWKIRVRFLYFRFWIGVHCKRVCSKREYIIHIRGKTLEYSVDVKSSTCCIETTKGLVSKADILLENVIKVHWGNDIRSDRKGSEGCANRNLQGARFCIAESWLKTNCLEAEKEGFTDYVFRFVYRKTSAGENTKSM